MRRGRPTDDGCGRGVTDCVRTDTANPQWTWRAPISSLTPLTCGNKSEPVADKPDDVANDDGPEQRALDSEESRQVNELLSTLPEKHRQILTLRLVVDMSAEETAAAVGNTRELFARHEAIASDEGR
ncbi:hypothetical protein MLGJGCBP_00273 [Rhodococcus sp. T7]|nr:hypothetical protein MLGJGCBP_00273 [Rhodococcus sp. T7]